MPDIEIRDNPKLKSISRNITELTFTGFVWGIWMYLLLPIVNVLLWIVGLKFIDTSVIDQVGYKELLGLIGKMGWIVLIVFIVFRLWGFYNYNKFGKKSRRKNAQPVTTEQLGKHFQVPSDAIKALQLQKEISWHYKK